VEIETSRSLVSAVVAVAGYTAAAVAAATGASLQGNATGYNNPCFLQAFRTHDNPLTRLFWKWCQAYASHSTWQAKGSYLSLDLHTGSCLLSCRDQCSLDSHSLTSKQQDCNLAQIWQFWHVQVDTNK
jgi:hypothetical protein